MKWQNDYNTGITSIDEQHQELCNMLNKLEEKMNSDDINQVMGMILKGLVEYVKFHFQDEEKIMSRIFYPKLEQHKKIHKDLVDQIVKILLDMKNGKEIEAVELHTFLKRWLRDHILEEDKKIGNHFYRRMSR